MPHSVIRGLTTRTPAELNEPPTFSMTTLLGLLSLADRRDPAAEVRTSAGALLAIAEVGREVALAAGAPPPRDGGPRGGRARRPSPAHITRVNGVLPDLFGRAVTVRRSDPRARAVLAERTVHLLDSFGYAYGPGGRPADPHDPPPGLERHDAGEHGRPVWRLRRAADAREVRPTGVLFRLNGEPARELRGERGTAGFTLLARRVSPLLRRFCRAPVAVRLLLLVLRQTASRFRRKLGEARAGPGLGPEHGARSLRALEGHLGRLQEEGVVGDFTIDEAADRLAVTRRPDWHREGRVGVAATGPPDVA